MFREFNKISYASWFVLPLLIFSILNFGNYSFLSYNFNGTAGSPIINSIKYVRIVLPIIPILFLIGSGSVLMKFLMVSLVKNFDIFIFIILLLIRAFLDDDVIYPLWYVFSIISFIITFMVFRIFSENAIEYLEKVILFILLCAIIAVPFTFFSIPKLFTSYDIYFSSKSSFAYYNLIIIVSYVCYLIIRNIRLRIRHLSFILLNVLVILLSGRRTPFITSMIILMIYMVFYSADFKSILIILSITVISILNIDYFSEHFLSIERLQKINLDEEGFDSSYRARLELREFYLKLIEKSNYLGIGFGNLSLSDKNKLSTHNTYLTVYLITGFFGLLFYLLVLARSLITSMLLKNKDIIICYIIMFLPLFTINWVETNFLPGQIFFIYTMSVLISPRFLRSYAK